MAAPTDTDDWLICTACGTQFPTADTAQLTTCFICDDARQFTPPGGQAFTTLRALKEVPAAAAAAAAAAHRNDFSRYAHDERVTFIRTTPRFAIGQRCALIATPAGNVLWDCVTLLDDATVARVNALGGVAAIVVSHPHYYTTHLLWARAFGCRVYLAAEDKAWLAQADPARHVFLERGETEREVLGAGGTGPTGVLALKPGGHFPGSLVLLFDGRLMVADTLVTTPAGLGSWRADALGRPRAGGRPEGMNSFAFMWSIPNMIPLSPGEISAMWDVLCRHEFRSTHGAFMGTDIEDVDVKRRLLQSMQIQVRRMGWPDHPFLGVKM